MKTRMGMALCGLLLAALSGCGTGDGFDENGADDLAAVPIDIDGKEDSPSRPTAQGALVLGVPVTRSLVAGRSGFHLYTFHADRSMTVRFAQKSAAFRTYLRVFGPNGRTWSAAGQWQRSGGYLATLELSLPAAGDYRVVATAYANVWYGYARVGGAYTLTAERRDPCAGRAIATCEQDTRCEVAAVGCENPCDADGVCHPCDPIPVCREKQAGDVGASCGSRGNAPCRDGLFCKFEPAAACGRTDAGGTCQARPVMCTRNYFPVCACDGRTYSNACEANAAGTSVLHDGACEGP